MNATTRALNPELFPTEPAPGMVDERKFPLSSPSPTRTNRSNTGKEFEKEIERTCGGYHSRRIAQIRKVDSPVRVIWIPDNANPGKKRQHVIFLKSNWLDWAGTWTTHDGRAILVEAKSTSTHRLPFNGSNGAGLKMEQVASIKTWHLSGAAVCVVWQWAGRVCLFTPQMLAAAEAGGAKSLVFANGLPVQRGDGTIVWDYLATLEGAIYTAEPKEPRIEFTYRGVKVYVSPGGRLNCDEVGLVGGVDVETALRFVDANYPADKKTNMAET